MHMFINAGEGDARDGHAALVCKGSPNGRLKIVEKLAYDSRVLVNLQNNALVDTYMMTQLAKEFVQSMKDRHNGLGCLLFCDNLSMHVAEELKDVFLKGSVF